MTSSKRKRRGKGEGSITRLPDGRWQARIDLGYVNGRRQRKAFYGKTRREAADKLHAALAALQRGQPLVSERATLGQLLDAWLTHIVRPGLRPKTYLVYSRVVRTHLAPAMGHVRLVALTPERVQAFLNAKLKSGLAPATVRLIHAVLRRALAQAERWGLVARNVARLATPPRVKRDEVRPLQPEEIRRLLQAASGDRLEALYWVALGLGLRQGELLGLRWEDVDLARGVIHVRVQLQRSGGAFHLVPPKGARSRRTVYCPPGVIAALRRHQARQAEERAAAGPLWQEWGLVFTGETGAPLHARSVVKRFHALLARAGLARRPFHTLRHTAASLLLASGLDIRVVQGVLGHAQIALTADLYTHLLPALLQDAAARVDAVLDMEGAADRACLECSG